MYAEDFNRKDNKMEKTTNPNAKRIIGKVYKIIMINRDNINIRENPDLLDVNGNKREKIDLRPYIQFASDYLQAENFDTISSYMNNGLTYAMEGDEIKNLDLFETVLFDTIGLIENKYNGVENDYNTKKHIQE